MPTIDPASRFLRACHCLPVDRVPVWFMRQAGRSLPEYRALRARHSFMDLARQPELCAEVTLQPVRRLGVDAAILFADIMTPLIALGLPIDLVEGVGPVIGHPIRNEADLAGLRDLIPEEDLPDVGDAIRIITRALPPGIPLIGFAGAPFTLASYLIEGKSSRNFLGVKACMYGAPDLWHALMARLTAITIAYGRAQIAAGVSAFQLFDSWAGCLSPPDYATYVHPYMLRIVDALATVPVILFGVETATLLEQQAQTAATVIGVDWRIPLDRAWDIIGHDRAIQGNLDPAVLLAPWEVVAEQARLVLRQAAGRPGHVFNLGHGIHPGTPVETLQRLVELVHAEPASPPGPRSVTDGAGEQVKKGSRYP